MKKFITSFVVLLCFVLISAQAQNIVGGGVYGDRKVAASYTGPGDQNTYVFWCGLRAYSLATAGTKAIRVVDSSNLNGTDINTLTNGDIDNATLNAWIVAHGTASVTTCYDKAGTKDVVNTTVANMPTITQNTIKTSFPSMKFNGTSSRLVSATTLTQAQPLTMTAVASSLSPTGSGLRQMIISDNANDNNDGLVFNPALPSLQLNPGPAVGTVYSASTFYMIQGYLPNSGVANSAILTVNGTDNFGTAATTGWSGAIDVGSGQAVERWLNGYIQEVGIVSSAVASRSGVDANARTYWGF